MGVYSKNKQSRRITATCWATSVEAGTEHQMGLCPKWVSFEERMPNCLCLEKMLFICSSLTL
ncbi:hypothetical protein M1N06_00700, partial [Peptococcaceae bacterium]|nr:hypothetical protein [Peptococcaceae bacterium]